MSDFHLHLLLGRPVPVPYDRHHASELHHFAEGRGHDGRVVELERDRPRDVQRGGQLSQDHVPKDLGAVIVVFVRVFHEWESVDVANEGFAVRSEIKGALRGECCALGYIGLVEKNLITEIMDWPFFENF